MREVGLEQQAPSAIIKQVQPNSANITSPTVKQLNRRG